MQKNEMTYIEFKSDLETLDKLKSVGLLTKTKTISSLNKIVYKKIEDDKTITSHPCEVIGFSWKNNPTNCINKMYENLRVNVDGKEFDINIDFLRDMQKKSWGAEKEIEEF